MYIFEFNSNKTIYISNTSELHIFIYIENIYGICNIKIITTEYNSTILNYLSQIYKFKLNIKNPYIINNNRIDFDKFKLFILDRLYVPELTKLYILDRKKYDIILIEYMNNRRNINDIRCLFEKRNDLLNDPNYIYYSSLYIYKYDLDILNLKTIKDTIISSDLSRFIINNKLYKVTANVFYFMYNQIYNNVLFRNINNEIYYRFEKKDSFICFYFDFISLNIYLLYKNINPNKIFKNHYTGIDKHFRIQSRYIFTYDSKYYSIYVYEYAPYILSYIKYHTHIYNYIKIVQNDIYPIN